MTRTIFAATVFALFLMLVAADARACSCAMPRGPAEAFGEAQAVFTVHVDKAVKNENGHATAFALSVEKVWKGSPGKSFTLGMPRHGCAYWQFEEGKDYLVYAEKSWDKDRPDDINITSCSRTKPLEKARIETRYLDAAAKGESTGALDAALPELLLGEQDPQARAEAATLIGEIALRSGDATSAAIVEALAKAATDESPVVRLAATRTLGSYKMAGHAAVKESLLARLGDEDRDVRAAAVGSFGMVTWRESRVFEALKSALAAARKDPHPDRGRQESLLYGFARALAEAAETGAQKDEAVDLLLGLVAEIRNPHNRVAPIQHLGFMKARAKKAAPVFLEVLKTADSHHLRQYTIIALGDIGAAETQAEIEPYLQDENCYVAAAVVQAVHKMNPAGFAAFFENKGMPVLKSRFDKCTHEFIYGLQPIGHDARAMEPFLKQKHAAMQDGDWKKQTLARLLDSWK